MNIVVGYDGSEASKKAIAKAKDLISSCEVFKISIVHVKKPNALNYAPFGGVVNIEHMEEVGEEVFGEDFKEMKEAAKGFKTAMVEVKTLEGSDPAKVLADYAKEEGYDLIVVGARGTGGLSKLKPGSVSKAIVDNCCVSVLVVK